MTGIIEVKAQTRLKIFTWHIHGSYLFYLSQGDYDLFIPVNKEKSEGYYGRGNTFPFGNNVHEIDSDAIKQMDFDLILFQTNKNYFEDQYLTLSDAQRKLPAIYLQHDPPWGHPTNSRHPVTDPAVTLVHVTHFNHLMWDNHQLKTVVIPHGVTVPEIQKKKKVARGIVVINNLTARGRLLGADLFEEVRKQVPLDLIGMGAATYGIGEVLHPQLPEFIAQYRFFFNPIRYTSLGLSVCEAMMVGLPIVGLATTELATTIENGITGYVHNDLNYLIEKMKFLLANPEKAAIMGMNARHTAMELFNIKQFTDNWEQLFHQKANKAHEY